MLQTNRSNYFHELQNNDDRFAGLSFESISTNVHEHVDFYEFILITEGEWENHMKYESFIMSTGTISLFKPKAIHQMFTAPSGNTHFVFCVEQHYFESYISRVFPTFEFDKLPECTTRAIGKDKLKYITSIANNLSQRPLFHNSSKEELLLLFMLEFVQEKEVLSYNTYINEIIKKLNNNQYLYYSVEDICSNYPYSHAVLCQQFKKITGYTIVEYKTKQKMKQACARLINTNYKVTDIASALGFESLSYFLRTFKKEIGMTPKEYRKLYKKGEIKNESSL